MVGVAQLVEHRVVVPGVAGSNPVAHPTFEGTDLTFQLLTSKVGKLDPSPPVH